VSITLHNHHAKRKSLIILRSLPFLAVLYFSTLSNKRQNFQKRISKQTNILFSRLIPYAEEIIGDHQCGFRRNKLTTDHIFRIRQILEKIWEYNKAVHQLFIDFKKAYDSVKREALYNIIIEFGTPRNWQG